MNIFNEETLKTLKIRYNYIVSHYNCMANRLYFNDFILGVISEISSCPLSTNDEKATEIANVLLLTSILKNNERGNKHDKHKS